MRKDPLHATWADPSPLFACIHKQHLNPARGPLRNKKFGPFGAKWVTRNVPHVEAISETLDKLDF